MCLQVSDTLRKTLLLLLQNLSTLCYKQFAQILELLVDVLYCVFVLLASLADLSLDLTYNSIKLLNRLVSLLKQFNSKLFRVK